MIKAILATATIMLASTAALAAPPDGYTYGYDGPYAYQDDYYGAPDDYMPPPPPPRHVRHAPHFYDNDSNADTCRSDNEAAGTILGAVTGGLIGGAVSHHHYGPHGGGSDAGAVIGGALLGGIVGNSISRSIPCDER